MHRRSQCISAQIVETTFAKITAILAVTASSAVRAVTSGMNVLTLGRLLLLLLLLGEEVGKADHPVKVGAEAVVMDTLNFHHQVLDILAEVKVPLDVMEARVVGLLPGGTLVGHPDSMVALLIPMELGTISVVPVSMVLPTEVALATKGLALALVSPTILQVTLQVLRAAVILGQVLALATAEMGPVGREMVVFSLKP